MITVKVNAVRQDFIDGSGTAEVSPISLRRAYARQIALPFQLHQAITSVSLDFFHENNIEFNRLEDDFDVTISEDDSDVIISFEDDREDIPVTGDHLTTIKHLFTAMNRYPYPEE